MTRRSLTIARLMIAIAILAVALGDIGMRRRSADFRRRAQDHARAGQWGGGSIGGSDEGLARMMNEIKEFTSYHDRMRRKYEYAALHPWVWVEPDPPPPVMPSVQFFE